MPLNSDYFREMGKLKLALTKVSDWNSFRINSKSSESFRNLYPNQIVSFRSNPKKFFNPNKSDRFEWINRIFRNHSDWFGLPGFFRIESSNWSNWPALFGLIRMTSSDWFCMNVPRIDSDWKLSNFGLDQNETVWCGFWNNQVSKKIVYNK